MCLRVYRSHAADRTICTTVLVTTVPFTHFWHCGTGCRGFFFCSCENITYTCTVCMCVHVHLYSERVEASERQDASIIFSLSRPNYHFTRPDNLSVRKNTPPDGIYYILLYCALGLDLISRPKYDHATVEIDVII